jgi:hypothetical protein
LCNIYFELTRLVIAGLRLFYWLVFEVVFYWFIHVFADKYNWFKVLRPLKAEYVNENRPLEVEQMNFFALKICFITLILCLFKVSKATESVDISRDFKILLTYFSEAFLKGATFDGKRLEGDNQTSVARYLVEAIGNLG